LTLLSFSPTPYYDITWQQYKVACTGKEEWIALRFDHP